MGPGVLRSDSRALEVSVTHVVASLAVASALQGVDLVPGRSGGRGSEFAGTYAAREAADLCGSYRRDARLSASMT
jgi:hypothetical protein